MDLYNRLELGDIRNVNEEEQEKYFYTPIYQILPLEYAISILQNRVLRFNNVFKYWEDPYELFLFKQNIFIEGTPFHINDYDKKLYGQCWSLNKDTDAMWRIYSKISRGQANDTVDSCEIGVRIKTTAERLQKLPSIITGFNRGHIGPVKYINQTVIDRNLQSLQLKNTKEYWDACDKTLFEKREEFSHEQKFRFVFLYTNGDPSYLEVQIKPQELIDEVTFDPRITKEDFDIQILNN